MVRIAGIIAIAVLLLLPCLSMAEDAVAAQAAFDHGKQAFGDGDFAAAAGWFEEARSQGMGGPAIYYNIGVCRYRMGDLDAARAAFAQVAKVPSMASLAHYNLGLVALKQADVPRATEHFTLAARGNDEKVRALALRQLNRLGPAPTPSPAPRAVQWLAFLSLQAGHDDNVALVNEDVPTAGDAVDSLFSEVFASLSARELWGSGFGVDGSAYLSQFADAGAYDQLALRLGGHYRHDADRFWTELGAHYAVASLDSDVYEQKWIASARLRWLLIRGMYVETLLSHEQIEAGAERFEYLEGTRRKVSLRGAWRRGVHGLRADYTYEINDRVDQGVSPLRHRLDLRYRIALLQDWSVELGAAWRESRYDDLQVSRDESLLTTGIRVNWDIGTAWQAYAEYNLGDNESTDAAYVYTRSQGFIGVNWVH